MRGLTELACGLLSSAPRMRCLSRLSSASRSSCSASRRIFQANNPLTTAITCDIIGVLGESGKNSARCGVNDGGPAFPSEGRIGDVPYVMTNTGMSLRDWFAGQALVGLMSNPAGTNHLYQELCKYAYGTADAMLAERQRPQGES